MLGWGGGGYAGSQPMSTAVHMEPIWKSNSITPMGPRVYRRKKTKGRQKAKRKHKITRDGEGIVERLVLKEVC